MTAEPVEPVDDTPWMHLEFNHDTKQFVWICSCEWEGSAVSLYRAAAGLSEHLRSCTGEKPIKRASHYRPEEHHEYVPRKAKTTAGQDN